MKQKYLSETNVIFDMFYNKIPYLFFDTFATCATCAILHLL